MIRPSGAGARGIPTSMIGCSEQRLAVLSEEGFAATTVAAVARRSGMHSSAIYRLWPSRIELIEEAVFPGFDEVSIRPTGDLRHDIGRFVGAYDRTLSSPSARVAIPGLLATYHEHGASPHPATCLSATVLSCHPPRGGTEECRSRH
jgi:AcrR family transcriptional regulator